MVTNTASALKISITLEVSLADWFLVISKTFYLFFSISLPPQAPSYIISNSITLCPISTGFTGILHFLLAIINTKRGETMPKNYKDRC